MTQALRYNTGKPRLSLLPPSIHYRQAYWLGQSDTEYTQLSKAIKVLIEVLYEGESPTDLIFTAHISFTKYKHELASVLAMGAEKYAPWNWTKGMPFMGVFDSLMRHVDRIVYHHEVTDEESGLPHTGHIAANLLFLIHYIEHIETYREYDDRPILKGGKVWTPDD